jgi:cytochrome c
MMRKGLFAGLATAALGACGGGDDDRPMTIEERGRAAFRECAVCHSVKDPAAVNYLALVGPSLYAIYGAPSAQQAGFDYSPAMKAANLVWDEATLDAFLADPQAVVPKTRMSYAGQADPDKRAAIIAYLKTLR